MVLIWLCLLVLATSISSARTPTVLDPIVDQALIPIVPKVNHDEPEFLVGFLLDSRSSDSTEHILKHSAYGSTPDTLKITLNSQNLKCYLPRTRHAYHSYHKYQSPKITGSTTDSSAAQHHDQILSRLSIPPPALHTTPVVDFFPSQRAESKPSAQQSGAKKTHTVDDLFKIPTSSTGQFYSEQLEVSRRQIRRQRLNEQRLLRSSQSTSTEAPVPSIHSIKSTLPPASQRGTHGIGTHRDGYTNNTAASQVYDSALQYPHAARAFWFQDPNALLQIAYGDGIHPLLSSGLTQVDGGDGMLPLQFTSPPGISATMHQIPVADLHYQDRLSTQFELEYTQLYIQQQYEYEQSRQQLFSFYKRQREKHVSTFMVPSLSPYRPISHQLSHYQPRLPHLHVHRALDQPLDVFIQLSPFRTYNKQFHQAILRESVFPSYVTSPHVECQSTSIGATTVTFCPNTKIEIVTSDGTSPTQRHVYHLDSAYDQQKLSSPSSSSYNTQLTSFHAALSTTWADDFISLVIPSISKDIPQLNADPPTALYSHDVAAQDYPIFTQPSGRVVNASTEQVFTHILQHPDAIHTELVHGVPRVYTLLLYSIKQHGLFQSLYPQLYGKMTPSQLPLIVKDSSSLSSFLLPSTTKNDDSEKRFIDVFEALPATILASFPPTTPRPELNTTIAIHIYLTTLVKLQQLYFPQRNVASPIRFRSTGDDGREAAAQREPEQYQELPWIELPSRIPLQFIRQLDIITQKQFTSAKETAKLFQQFDLNQEPSVLSSRSSSSTPNTHRALSLNDLFHHILAPIYDTMSTSKVSSHFQSSPSSTAEPVTHFDAVCDAILKGQWKSLRHHLPHHYSLPSIRQELHRFYTIINQITPILSHLVSQSQHVGEEEHPSSTQDEFINLLIHTVSNLLTNEIISNHWSLDDVLSKDQLRGLLNTPFNFEFEKASTQAAGGDSQHAKQAATASSTIDILDILSSILERNTLSNISLAFATGGLTLHHMFSSDNLQFDDILRNGVYTKTTLAPFPQHLLTPWMSMHHRIPNASQMFPNIEQLLTQQVHPPLTAVSGPSEFQASHYVTPSPMLVKLSRVITQSVMEGTPLPHNSDWDALKRILQAQTTISADDVKTILHHGSGDQSLTQQFTLASSSRRHAETQHTPATQPVPITGDHLKVQYHCDPEYLPITPPHNVATHYSPRVQVALSRSSSSPSSQTMQKQSHSDLYSQYMSSTSPLANSPSHSFSPSSTLVYNQQILANQSNYHQGIADHHPLPSWDTLSAHSPSVNQVIEHLYRGLDIPPHSLYASDATTHISSGTYPFAAHLSQLYALHPQLRYRYYSPHGDITGALYRDFPLSAELFGRFRHVYSRVLNNDKTAREAGSHTYTRTAFAPPSTAQSPQSSAPSGFESKIASISLETHGNMTLDNLPWTVYDVKYPQQSHIVRVKQRQEKEHSLQPVGKNSHQMTSTSALAPTRLTTMASRWNPIVTMLSAQRKYYQYSVSTVLTSLNIEVSPASPKHHRFKVIGITYDPVVDNAHLLDNDNAHRTPRTPAILHISTPDVCPHIALARVAERQHQRQSSAAPAQKNPPEYPVSSPSLQTQFKIQERFASRMLPSYDLPFANQLSLAMYNDPLLPDSKSKSRTPSQWKWPESLPQMRSTLASKTALASHVLPLHHLEAAYILDEVFASFFSDGQFYDSMRRNARLTEESIFAPRQTKRKSLSATETVSLTSLSQHLPCLPFRPPSSGDHRAYLVCPHLAVQYSSPSQTHNPSILNRYGQHALNLHDFTAFSQNIIGSLTPTLYDVDEHHTTLLTSFYRVYAELYSATSPATRHDRLQTMVKQPAAQQKRFSVPLLGTNPLSITSLARHIDIVVNEKPRPTPQLDHTMNPLTNSSVLPSSDLYITYSLSHGESCPSLSTTQASDSNHHHHPTTWQTEYRFYCQAPSNPAVTPSTKYITQEISPADRLNVFGKRTLAGIVTNVRETKPCHIVVDIMSPSVCKFSLFQTYNVPLAADLIAQAAGSTPSLQSPSHTTPNKDALNTPRSDSATLLQDATSNEIIQHLTTLSISSKSTADIPFEANLNEIVCIIDDSSSKAQAQLQQSVHRSLSGETNHTLIHLDQLLNTTMTSRSSRELHQLRLLNPFDDYPHFHSSIPMFSATPVRFDLNDGTYSLLDTLLEFNDDPMQASEDLDQ